MTLGAPVPADRIVGILARHLSEPNARAVLGRAMRHLGQGEITRSTLPALVSAMERGVRLFAGQAEYDDIEGRLLELVRVKPTAAIEVPIRHEADVSVARLAARDHCQAHGCKALITQRIATAVSELGRNIALYTPGGRVRLEPVGTPTSTIRIVASDEGTGIEDLALVLSGEYRSKTGMGRGLSGVRRLADRFDVETGPGGTVVTLEIRIDRGGAP